MVTASWPWPASATKMRLVSAWSSDVSSSDRSEEHTSELQSLTNLVCRLLLRSEEHTSELQSLTNLVCRLLLEKKEHTSELQSLTNLVCRLLLEKQTCALRSEEHTSELQSLTNLVCRLLLETKRLSPFTVPYMITNMAAGIVSIHLGAKGPNSCSVTACASGTNSIGDAFRILQRGDAEVMLAGGAEAAISPLGIGSFCAARA